MSLGEVPLVATRIVLGLLGAIGAGKSHVARHLARVAGGAVVDADELAGEVLEVAARDGRLEALLGPEARRADGSPDREAIGRRVFAHEPSREALEGLIHPEVRRRIEKRIRDHRAGDGPPLLVLDVPLLLETGLDRHCDALWYVEAPEELRHRRAAGRGLTPEAIRRRERRQVPLDRKRARADLVVHNDRELAPQVIEGLSALGIPVEAHP